MKFQFAYRDSLNERHDGIVVASSKDDAFKKLRSRGIRPFFVAPAPGFFNKLSSIGKRWFAIIVLLLIASALLVALLNLHFSTKSLSNGSESPRPSQSNLARQSFDAVINSPVRRQPIGDVAIIDAGVRNAWADVFALEGERFLASFAIPGVNASLRNTSEAEIKKALESSRLIDPSDSLEARQMIAMVEGMKEELRRYLAAGGTIAEYGDELVSRQETEIAHRKRAEHAVLELVRKGSAAEEVVSLLNKFNRQFRRMGINPLTMPKNENGGL